MPDGNDKYSSWSGTNNVLVSTGQEAQASSVPKTNYANTDDKSSWDANVPENPFKYDFSNANSKIYPTNNYNQYVTKQWSQSQAAKRYNIQTPKVQNPRYNISSKPIARMSEDSFKDKYSSKFEALFNAMDTAGGAGGDVGTFATLDPVASVITRIAQCIKSIGEGMKSLWNELCLLSEVEIINQHAFRSIFEAEAKKVYAVTEGSSKTAGWVDKVNKGCLWVLLAIVIYRGIRWAMSSGEESDVWASKFRGACYNLLITAVVQKVSSSHPIAVVVAIAVAIMDVVFMILSNGECDFGYAFDLGLQWWGETIKGWHKASVDYIAETVIPFYVDVGHDISEGYDASVDYFAEDVFPFYEEVGHEIAEGASEAAEVTSDYFTETVGPFWKEVGNDIVDGVGDFIDRIPTDSPSSFEQSGGLLLD